MTFQEQMDLVLEQWEKNPIPLDFQTINENKQMCSVEGVMQQLDNLSSGAGTIYVALATEGSTAIEIKPIHIFKQ
jgi:hypothetical protein